MRPRNRRLRVRAAGERVIIDIVPVDQVAEDHAPVEVPLVVLGDGMAQPGDTFPRLAPAARIGLGILRIRHRGNGERTDHGMLGLSAGG